MNINENLYKNSFNNPDLDNFYNIKKYSQILEPKSDLEKEIWSQIEKADAPIINILKRLNRISLDKFPDDEFITRDSCSGHVSNNRNMEQQPHIFFGVKPRYKTIEKDGEEYDEIDDFDEKYSEKFIGFFRKVFIDSINKINEKYNSKIAALGYFDYRKKEDGQFINKEYINKEPVLNYDTRSKESFYIYNIGYYFHINNTEKEQILKDFWSIVEEELEKIDGIKYKTDFNSTSFL
jgi:hypothetical protein